MGAQTTTTKLCLLIGNPQTWLADFSGISFFSCRHVCHIPPNWYCGADCCMHHHRHHSGHRDHCLLLAEASRKKRGGNQAGWVWIHAYRFGSSLETIRKAVQLQLVPRHAWMKSAIHVWPTGSHSESWYCQKEILLMNSLWIYDIGGHPAPC